MQQLVYESVAEQHLVSSKNRIEADSDSTWCDPQSTSSEQLVGVEFESGHTKTTLLIREPLDSQVLAKVTQERSIVLSEYLLQFVEKSLGQLRLACCSRPSSVLDHATACPILLKWPSSVARPLGVWRSLEARFLGMEEAPSSNLGTSTILAISARSVPSSSLIPKYQDMKPLEPVQMVFGEAYCIDTK